MDDSDLEDLFSDSGGSHGFYMPTESVQTSHRRMRDAEGLGIRLFLQSKHDKLKDNEVKHKATRAKSFELLRLQEDCANFHEMLANRELSTGTSLEISLISEILIENSRREDIEDHHWVGRVGFGPTFLHVKSPTTTEATRKVMEDYLAEYERMKDNPQTIEFPWPTWDKDVQVSCLRLLKENQTDQCRVYLTGFMECIGRVDLIDQTSQGKTFSEMVRNSSRICVKISIHQVYDLFVSLLLWGH